MQSLLPNSDSGGRFAVIVVIIAILVTAQGCKSTAANRIEEILFVPAPAREMRFSTAVKEYLITYPHWIDQFHFFPKIDDNLSCEIRDSAGRKLESPLSIGMGSNDFTAVIINKKNSRIVDKHKISVTRNPWQSVKLNAEFAPRDGAGIVEFDGKLWLLGGWLGYKGDTVNTISEIWNSENGENWTFIGNAPWPSRHCITPIVFQNKIWVIGGDGHDDVWNSSDGIEWHQILDNAPWGHRYSPFIFSHDNKLWLMGGISWWDEQGTYTFPKDGKTQSFNDVWSSEDGITWNQLIQHAPWSPRGLVHGSVVFQNKMWIIGGGVKDSEIISANNDVWTSADGISWNCVTDKAPWSPRLHFSVAVYNGKMWLTDGSVAPRQSNYSNEVWYSPDGKNWDRLFGSPWLPRHASSLIAFRGNLLITCGSVPGNVINDSWMIRP